MVPRNHAFRPLTLSWSDGSNGRGAQRHSSYSSQEPTIAYLSDRPSGGALVFAHGFGGRSLATWLQFPALLQQTAECAEWDLIFYGYDSLYRTVRSNALTFARFLEVLSRAPAPLMNAAVPSDVGLRPAEFTYNRMVVVAHSLGAVIARQALLEIRSQGFAWFHKVELALYAPADGGSDVGRLASEALTGIPWAGHVASAFMKSQFPVLADLEPGSQALTVLHQDTMAALLNGEAGNLIAKRIALAERDNVTKQNRFLVDEMPVTVIVPRTRHKTVCKPAPSFREPLELLVRVL